MSETLETLRAVHADAFDTMRRLLGRKKLGDADPNDDSQAAIRLETARLAAIKAALGVGGAAQTLIERASKEGAPHVPKP